MSMMFSLPAMKFIIGCFFLGVIIVAIARAEESYLEDLADGELNDRPPLKKPNARVSSEIFVTVLSFAVVAADYWRSLFGFPLRF